MEKKTHILLVDDEQDITSNLAAYLNRSGFETSVAGDGKEALQKGEQNPFDLTVLDVLMPSERGTVLQEGADNSINKSLDPHDLGVRKRAGSRHRPPLSKTVLCLSIIVLVMIGCTTPPSMVPTTPENLPIKCIPTNSTERFIVSNRQMSLTVVDVEVAIEQVEKIITEFGGYVDQEQAQVYRSTEANFAIRLPKESLGEASDKIKTVAKEIRNEWAIGQDITEQYANLEDQLCALEAEYIALREKIAQNPADHLSAQLVNLESEIEFIHGKINYRDERLALATLTLHLSSE